MPQVTRGKLDDEKQWDKDLMKILKARQVDIVDLEIVEEMSRAKERYDSSAIQMQDKVTPENVAALEKALNRQDARRFIERRIKALDQRLGIYAQQHFNQIKNDEKFEQKFKDSRQLLEDAQQLVDEGRYKEAAGLLKQCEELAFIPPVEMIPALPTKSPPRQLSPFAVEKALQRDDLAARIAQNDTWGNFDLDRALNSDPPSEADAKVLWNVLESAVEADAEDEKWEEYQASVQESVLQRQLYQRITEADRQRGEYAQQNFQRLKHEESFNELHEECRKIVERAKKEFKGGQFNEARASLEEFLKSEFITGAGIETPDREIAAVRRQVMEADRVRGVYAQNNFQRLKDDENFNTAHEEAWDIIRRAETAVDENNLVAARELLDDFSKTPYMQDAGLSFPDPFTIFKEIILGAGASAAYYICNNESKIDIPNTLMIGKVQPWAGERGKDGNINHPHNMIDPEHAANEIRSEDGLAKRTEFSERVAKVVGRLNNTEAQITKVIKCPGDFYEVQTNKGNFYGKKITNALGIGNHKTPPNDVTGAAKEKFQDMDTFKRKLDGRNANFQNQFPGVSDVAIIGPNAAIDVATTIIRENRSIEGDENKIRIHWFVGDRTPFFLDGTDNELVSEQYPDFADDQRIDEKGPITSYKWDFLNASGSDAVTISYGARANDRAKPKVPAEVEGTLAVDLAVYAIGPDTGAMKRLFADETKNEKKAESLDLEPIYDVDQQFNLKLEVKDPVKLIDEFKLNGPEDAALRELLTDPNIKDADNLFEVLPPVIGVKASGKSGDQSSMEFVGASAMRMAQNDRLTYDYIQTIIDEKKEEAAGGAKNEIEGFHTVLTDFKKKENQNLDFVKDRINMLQHIGDDPAVQMIGRMLREFLRLHIKTEDDEESFDSYGSRVVGAPGQGAMGTVTSALPENVVVNDQLTASRAQIEARYHEMPTDPESVPLAGRRGGINFITSNHTVVATHIATCYPNVPVGLANYLTAQIINARTSWTGTDRPLPARKDEVDPVEHERLHDLRQQKAFQDEWVRRLQAFEDKFRA